MANNRCSLIEPIATVTITSSSNVHVDSVDSVDGHNNGDASGIGSNDHASDIGSSAHDSNALEGRYRC